MLTPESPVVASGPVTAREMLVVILACLALTVLFGLPWYPNPVTIPTTYQGASQHHAHTDAGIWTFLLAWGAAHPDRFYDAPVMVPLPHPLVANDPRLTEGIWSIPLFRLFPPVLAWGLAQWIALFTGALGAYFAGRLLFASHWAGAAVLVLFGFGNFHATHVCHIEGTFAPFLPLVFNALALALDHPTRRRVVIGLFIAVLAVIEYSYTAVPLALLLPPILLWGAWRRKLPLRRTLLVLILAGFAIALILAPVALLYRRFHEATLIARHGTDHNLFSADLLAWCTSPDNRVFSPFGGPGHDYFDLQLFPGFVLTALGLIGLRGFWKRSPEILLFGAGAFLLSFGTWRRLAWELDLPHIGFPTPYEILSMFLLPLRAIRAPGRFAVFVHLVLAFSAAGVVLRLAARSRIWQVALVLLFVLSFWEARAGMHPIRLLPERAGDPAWRWLAEQDESGAVIDHPMGQHTIRAGDRHDIQSLFTFLMHGKPTPNGGIATFIPWHESLAVHLARPRPHETLLILRALGVRYVYATDTAAAASWIRAGLRPVYASDSGSFVLIVDSGVQSVPASPRELQDRLFPFFSEHGVVRDSVTPIVGTLRVDNPAVCRAGRPVIFAMVARNDGVDTWCASGALFGFGINRDVLVAIRRWQDVERPNRSVRDMEGYPLHAITLLPCDLAPGETVACGMRALAPPRPGNYRVFFDIYQGDKGWVHERDSAVILPIRVLP